MIAKRIIQRAADTHRHAGWFLTWLHANPYHVKSHQMLPEGLSHPIKPVLCGELGSEGELL
jgi:hypothetical protein